MASGGHTGAHMPHPLQTELLTTATVFPSTSSCRIASKGQASAHFPHQLQRSLFTSATIGSVSSVPLLISEKDLVAADRAELTDSVMFFGPWQLPAMVTPSITVSTGRSFMCTSL